MSRIKHQNHTQDSNNIVKDLELVYQTINASIKLKKFFLDRNKSFDEKQQALNQIFQDFLSPRSYNFLSILLQNNALSTLPQIIKEQKNYGAQDKITEVEVRTIVPLSINQKKQIIAAVTKRIGKKIILTEILDNNILGGLLIKAGDEVIDLTLKTKLAQLKKNLLNT